MKFGDRLIQTGVNFTVDKGTIFAIMGGSGCGRSALLKHLVGLLPPAKGAVEYEGVDYWAVDDAGQARLRTGFGMLFQTAALWSSMTILENVCLPLEQQGALGEASRRARAREVLEWVDLGPFADLCPSDLSGGMKKRAGLARAIGPKPPLLFLDAPSAGLDPINSKKLDNLILDIRERTGCAVVFVSHELPSLFAIADDGIFLDADRSRAQAPPRRPRCRRRPKPPSKSGPTRPRPWPRSRNSPTPPDRPGSPHNPSCSARWWARARRPNRRAWR